MKAAISNSKATCIIREHLEKIPSVYFLVAIL